MSTSIKLKKSSIAGRIPSLSDLDYGELAINYSDGVLYYKNSSNAIQKISGNAVGVDSDAVFAIIDSNYIQNRIDQTFINNLDVNAGTLDGQDGTYFLDYNNFTNTPTAVDFRDSAFVASVASDTTSPADSASVTSIIDSAYIANIVSNEYVATIVDSDYVALRVGDFAENFGTIAVVGDLSIDATEGGDTLTFAAGDGVDISTNVAQKRVTITSALQTDLSPQLGNDLNTNGFNITGSGDVRTTVFGVDMREVDGIQRFIKGFDFGDIDNVVTNFMEYLAATTAIDFGTYVSPNQIKVDLGNI